MCIFSHLFFILIMHLIICKKPLLNLGDIQNNKMVCLISGPRVYMQNKYINIETHI